MRHLLCAAIAIGLCTDARALDSADILVANSYDDAWESAWASTMRNVHTDPSSSAPVAVKVIHVGDSMTFSSGAANWARAGLNRSAEDLAIVAWANANNADHTVDGIYLSQTPVADGSPPEGGYTAEPGLGTAAFLAGPAGGLPNCDAMFTTGNVGGAYAGHSDFTGTDAATICFLMLGSNDIGAGRPAHEFRTDLVSIIEKIMTGKRTIVCLVTVPPHVTLDVTDHNAVIRDIAQNGLVIAGVNAGNRVYFPLVDFYQAIMYRQPTEWATHLLYVDGTHPSGDGAGDPYAASGAELSVDGWLLRCWLWVQKTKEIKRYCVDGDLPASTNPPVANAGADRADVEAGSWVTLDGTGSTDATDYAWAFVDMQPAGAYPALANADTASPTFIAGAPGVSYTIGLTVTDGGSETSYDELTVSVDAAFAEAVIAGQTTAVAGATVVVSASPSWTWNGAAGYSWSVSPPPPDLAGASTQVLSFTAATAGDTYVVDLMVDDTLGHADTASLVVTVVDPNAITGNAGNAGLSCTALPGAGPGAIVYMMVFAGVVAAARRRASRDL